jgi:hypothetical protein
MNMIRNTASERQEIEALLPWHAAGTLSRREAQKVEQALQSDADLAIQYATVQQDLVETIGLNEIARRAFGAGDAEADGRHPSRRLDGAPRALLVQSRRMAERKALVVLAAHARVVGDGCGACRCTAGWPARRHVRERAAGGDFHTASVQTDQAIKGGTYALIRFAPEATTAEVNRLLENYKIAIVDGPSGGGVYTVRLAVTGMPKEELARTVKKLQDENVVRFIGPKPTE